MTNAPPDSEGWPTASIDAVARLRAIAAARPHLAYHERTIDAPFERVWSVFGDLEGCVPRYDRSVRWLRVVAREGERLVVESSSPIPGRTLRFEAIYRPGWCVMRAFEAEVGMAAAPLGPDATRVAHFEGSRVLGRIGRWWFGRGIAEELETVAQMCGAGR